VTVTVRFRLRFTVALALAVVLLLGFYARESLAQGPRTSEYIVQMEAGSTPAQGQRMVTELGGQVTSPALPVINGFGAMLEDEAADELSTRVEVEAVTPNAATTGEEETTTSGGARCPGAAVRQKRPAPSRPAARDVNPQRALWRLGQPLQATVGADRAWMRGVTGDGVGVAVVDTGIAGYLPDFMGSGGSRVIASVVTNPCANDADDHVGHGTHVAGLIAANSLNSWGAGKLAGRYMGVAPRADLISVKVSDDTGDTTVLDVIYGLQFVIDHKHDLGIRVVNLSLSSSVAESYRTDPLDAAVEAAWFAGVVVVAASGNDGTASQAVSYAPGNDPYVITAGALDDRGTKRLTDDALASWSSRGLTQDGFQKPDVLAPGNGLVAPLAPGSSFATLCRSCMVGRTYFRLSGTSMATAVVSGTVALVLEDDPAMTPNEVKGALVATARNVPGAGAAVDAYAALDGHGSANEGLVPSTLIDPGTLGIDSTRASFRRASFRDAAGSPFAALWTRASFRCTCGLEASGDIDPARASFRRVSFRRTVDFHP
jgi:serine protease AprX